MMDCGSSEVKSGSKVYLTKGPVSTYVIKYAACARIYPEDSPPLSSERFWPPKPYMEGSKTGDELFILGIWSPPILAVICGQNSRYMMIPFQHTLPFQHNLGQPFISVTPRLSFLLDLKHQLWSKVWSL